MFDDNVYYDLIKQDIKDDIKYKDNIESWIKNDVIYSDFEYPYELIQEHLKLSNEEFEEFKNTNDFNDEWENFCYAEQEVLEELKKSIEQ